MRESDDRDCQVIAKDIFAGLVSCVMRAVLCTLCVMRAVLSMLCVTRAVLCMLCVMRVIYGEGVL